MSSIDIGFDCEFTEKPPKRSNCPICLLILREPYQVTCCGETFCQDCIQPIKTRNRPCPKCQRTNFDHYPDKGLEQELYSSRVFCSNKGKGCDWLGELRQLDQHLNANPDENNQFNGCAFTNIKCLYCAKEDQRLAIKRHQTGYCKKRSFVCKICKEFESTYDDVTKIHILSCKSRLVECPNQCGETMTYENYEEHLLNVCPLSEVKCEFSSAGCNLKMTRKDLPSHLSESIVSHMSLLANENQRLKLELQKQAALFKAESLKQASMMQVLHDLPATPVNIIYSNYSKHIEEGTEWSSQPFYMGGCKIQLSIVPFIISKVKLKLIILEKQFEYKPLSVLSITVIDQINDKDHKACLTKFESEKNGLSSYTTTIDPNPDKHIKNDSLLIQVNLAKEKQKQINKQTKKPKIKEEQT